MSSDTSSDPGPRGPATAGGDESAVLCRRAEEAWDRGRWDEALALAEEAASRAPRCADAWSGQALALLALHRDADSLNAARRAVGCDPASPSAGRALALALLRHRRIDEAERTLAAVLGNGQPTGPTRERYPEGLATLALLRMVQGRLQEADALFRNALDAKGTMAEAIGNHAALLSRLGRDGEALEAAGRAASLKPFLPAPHMLRGTLLHRAGRFAEAADAFAAAVAADPGVPDHHAGHADALRRAGRPEEAARAARAGLARHSGHVALHGNLGAALHALGRTDEALAAYRNALARAPDLAEVENNIARLHGDAGRIDLALLHMRHAVALRPDEVEIARGFAGLLLAAGLTGEAEPVARRAAQADPRSADGLILLGRALGRLNRGEEAETVFAAALRLDPLRPDGWFQAGAALLQAGRRAGAVGALRRLCRLAPKEPRHWALLGQSLRRVRFAAADEELRTDLAAALAHPGAENAHLADAVTSVVRLAPAVDRLLGAASGPDPDAAVRALLDRGDLDGLARDGLLHALLDGCIVTDPAMERALTVLRRVFLARASGGESDDPVWLPLLCALAGQCFLTEYVFAETSAEGATADALRTALETGPDTVPPERLALLAAYRPLHRLRGAASLAGRSWPEPVARLLARQVTEPLAEEALKAGLPRLTPIRDATSAAVRAQYEENPYPRWEQAGLLGTPVPVPAAMHALFAHAPVAPGPQWEAPEILVAGCGSGREAVWAANHFRGARVLAVDLSLTSLAHGARQAQRLGLDIAWAQGDILKLDDAFAGTGDDPPRRFDLIQCVGVLHHMEDPPAGLRVLAGLLRPHGLMKIGLYSDHARRPVASARAFVAAQGYDASTAGIRRFRQDALALPDGHPVGPVTQSPDFFSTSGCRDLVFHVREHRLDLPSIAGWLADLKLEFLGFQLEDQAVAALYRSRFPQDPAMTDLTLWDRFEAEHPHVFGELYQFWVRPAA